MNRCKKLFGAAQAMMLIAVASTATLGEARRQPNALSNLGATTALERFYQPNQCGAVALYAVCRIQGVPAKIAELAKLAGTDRHGTTAGGIVRAARAKGLEARAWKSTVRHLRRLNGPVIIDFPRGHFVVLAGWTDDRAVIIDPPAPVATIDVRDLQKNWGGAAITFSSRQAEK